MGFIETPYRKVEKGKVDMSGKAFYITAEDEDDSYIAQANADLKVSGHFTQGHVDTTAKITSASLNDSNNFGETEVPKVPIKFSHLLSIKS